MHGPPLVLQTMKKLCPMLLRAGRIFAAKAAQQLNLGGRQGIKRSKGVQNKNMKISPSILASDFSRLGEELAAIEKTGNRYIHLDVMDGVFVPNLTFGPPVVRALRKNSSLFFDTHLMIVNPKQYIDDFIEAGSDGITIHYECDNDVYEVLKMIRAKGKKAGISFRPKTKVREIADLLPYVDLVLVMSVEPGFGGQEFIPESVEKIRQLDRLRRHKSLDFEIEVDGGITKSTIGPCAEAGLDIAVAGSSVFKTDDYKAAIEGLIKASEK